MTRSKVGVAGRMILAGAAVLIASAAPPAVAQQPIMMKFGTQTQNDVQHEYMKLYKAALEKATNGRIQVGMYPASQLGPFPRQIEGLRLGNIEALTGPFEFFVGVDPSFQATAMTGLFKDTEHMRRVIDKPEFRKVLQDIGDRRGVLVTGFIVYDMQQFAFKQPAASLADFKGRRLRVLASEAEQASVQALGAASIPIPLAEVLPALQQGTIDGLSATISVFTTFRYYDAAPHALDSRLWGVLTGVLISREWHSKLPPDLQKAVIDVSRQIEAENHAWNVTFLKGIRETWAKNGGKMVVLSATEQAEAQRRVTEATQKVLDKHPAVKATYSALKAIADATN